MCGIVEEKTEQQFNNNAICQTIGYHIARRVATATGKGMYSNTQTDIHLYVQSHLLYCCTLSTLDEEVKAPLAILFCEDEVRFVFFPNNLPVLMVS